MELNSPPEMKERKWTEVEIGFPGGAQTYAIEANDDMTVGSESLLLEFAEGQVVWVNLALIAWYSTRPRTQMVPVKASK